MRFVLVRAKTSASDSLDAERAAAAPKPAEYEREVKWTGRVWGRQAKGWKTGTRLYARKQFMFKGHAWEKVINLRRKFISLRLRSQKRRIRRWHAVSLVVFLLGSQLMLNAVAGRTSKSIRKGQAYGKDTLLELYSTLPCNYLQLVLFLGSLLATSSSPGNRLGQRAVCWVRPQSSKGHKHRSKKFRTSSNVPAFGVFFLWSIEYQLREISPLYSYRRLTCCPG